MTAHQAPEIILFDIPTRGTPHAMTRTDLFDLIAAPHLNTDRDPCDECDCGDCECES